MSFQPRHRDELLKLPDEKIIDYSVAARDAGDLDAFAKAVAAFVSRRKKMVEGMVARKIGPLEDRENVVQEVFLSVLQSAGTITGSHVGEFVSWIQTVTKYRIADYHAKRDRELEREQSVHVPLSGDDEWYFEIADLADDQGAVGMLHLIGRVMADRSLLHRRTIQLRMDGYPSLEVVEVLGVNSGMTASNVDKIFSRFREDVREELRESRD